MSDFDKILRDKLSEEDDFPRMDQNWQKLSARMTAVNTPVPTPHPQLVAWKWAMAATGLLLVTSNIWWWFHQKESTATVVATPNVQQLPDAHTPPTTIYKTDTVYKIVYRDIDSNKAQQGRSFEKAEDAPKKIGNKNNPSRFSQDKPVLESPNVKKSTERLVVKPNLDKKQPHSDTQFEKNTPIAHDKNIDKKTNKDLKKEDKPVIQDNKVLKNDPQPVVSNENKKDKESVVSYEKNKEEPLKTPVKEGEKPLNTEGGVKDNQPVVDAEKNTKEVPNKENITPIKQDTASKIAIGEIPKNTKVDTATSVSPNKKENKGENPVVNTPNETKQDMESAPIIKPFKWKPEFSIGANALVALPIGKDFSDMKGGGVYLGMKISDHFRVDIVGNTGELRYRIKEHKPRLHIPKDPRNRPGGPVPTDVELREIEGFQKRKQVALLVTYLFSSKGWLTPKLELGYAIQRIANQTAKYEFRDLRTGKELYSVEKLEPQTFKNLWHVGAGAEKSFGNFTADLTTTFQKDFSDKSVDMLVLRGGLRYSF